jgi:hypothetical protein
MAKISERLFAPTSNLTRSEQILGRFKKSVVFLKYFSIWRLKNPQRDTSETEGELLITALIKERIRQTNCTDRHEVV